ncbi:unnamed protein product [Heterobilharzia americana]|nr:unnamed protein product [Heterobilharzia americana]
MSSPESVVLPDGRRIGDLKVADLRTQLELRGLSRSGVKKDLCARLSDAVGGELVLEEKKSGSTVEPMGSNSSLDDNSTQNEDTLEINAVASDEEIFEVSAPGDTGNAEKEIPRSEESICKSPSASSECTMGTLNDIEKPTGIANANTTENIETSDQLAPTEDNKSETEVQPQRRRQWGSRSISSTPSLSSESLEKLIPPSACWVRSKSLVVDTENEAQSNDPVVLQDITEHDEAIKYPTVPDEKTRTI